jgi:hypothetical protein
MVQSGDGAGFELAGLEQRLAGQDLESYMAVGVFGERPALTAAMAVDKLFGQFVDRIVVRTQVPQGNLPCSWREMANNSTA